MEIGITLEPSEEIQSKRLTSHFRIFSDVFGTKQYPLNVVGPMYGRAPMSIGVEEESGLSSSHLMFVSPLN